MQESNRNPEQEQHEEAAPLHEQAEHKNDKIVFQAMPDLSEEEAYQQLQQQNRRRLIGAGVVTLAVAGLFAAISSGGSDSAEQAASAPGLSGNTPVAAPTLNVASAPTASLPALTADNGAASDLPELPALYDSQPSAPVAMEEVPEAPTMTEGNGGTVAADAPIPGVPSATEPVKRSSAQQAQEAAAKAAAQRLAREQQAAANASRAKQAALEKRQAEQARLQAQREQKQEQQRAKAAEQRETAKAIPSGKGSLMVQAGAFKTAAQAQKVQKQLQGMGFSARITEVKTDKGTFLRVQAGPFADRSAANAAAARMKSNGLGGMVVSK